MQHNDEIAPDQYAEEPSYEQDGTHGCVGRQRDHDRSFSGSRAFGVLAKDNGTDDGTEQKDADDFELQDMVAEHLDTDGIGITVLQDDASRSSTLRTIERRLQEEDRARTPPPGPQARQNTEPMDENSVRPF